MGQNLISIEVPEKVIDAVREHLSSAIELLKPYVKGLSKSEREELTKMGDKSVSFAGKVNAYMTTHSQYIPAYIDVAEYQKDYAVPPALKQIHQFAQSVFEILDDTTMAAGSDIMEVSNGYYNSVRIAAAAGEAGAKAIYDDLKARYPGKASKHNPA